MSYFTDSNMVSGIDRTAVRYSIGDHHEGFDIAVAVDTAVVAVDTAAAVAVAADTAVVAARTSHWGVDSHRKPHHRPNPHWAK